MADQAARELVRLGGDPAAFSARQLTGDLVSGADLVVTATRAQRAVVATLVPRSTRYCFSVLELARLLAMVVDTVPRTSARERVRGLAVAAAANRGLAPPPVAPESDDVPDPYGGPVAAYRHASELMAPAVLALATAISRPQGTAGLDLD